MIVLGIETTCDETAIAVVRDGTEILHQAVASSADLHALFGGVFPELASRRHIQVIGPLLREALAFPIDLIAVAHTPGLMGSLLVGLQAAQGLALALEKPLVGVNHVEAHLYAAMMGAPWLFPALGWVVSGGHTLLYRMEGPTQLRLLGTTVDDAIGEAFDKVASMLGLPYPGGPHVERLAQGGDPTRVLLPVGKVRGSPLDLSYSGLKTAVRLAQGAKEDIAASFQEAAFEALLSRTRLALAEGGYQAIYLGGGVTANARLKERFIGAFSVPVFFPPKALALDNGAMIAGLGFHLYRERGADPLDLEARPRYNFSL